MNMNREIKFRAWDIEKKRLISSEEVNDWRIGGSLQSELFEIMQFTGLKDKNGVEIYEGDIVECFNDGLSEVLFNKGSFGLFTYTYDSVSFYTFNEVYGACEIIGNIYENPELLEVYEV